MGPKSRWGPDLNDGSHHRGELGQRHADQDASEGTLIIATIVLLNQRESLPHGAQLLKAPRLDLLGSGVP